MLQRELLHSQPLESAREKLEAPIPQLWNFGDSCRKLLGSRDRSKNSSSSFSTFPGAPGESSQDLLQECGAAPTVPFGSTISFLLSMAPTFPRTLLLLNPEGFGSFFPNSWEAEELWSCSELHTLIIPRDSSQGLFPGIFPCPRPHLQLSSEDQSLAMTPWSRWIFPENSPPFFFPSLPHTLKFPRRAREIWRDQFLTHAENQKKPQKSRDSKRKTFQENSGIVP